MFCKGDFVTINEKVGIVVLTGDALGLDMADHVGVWFGDLKGGVPEVWTIPLEYISKGPQPELKH